jgi:hypothetical protein
MPGDQISLLRQLNRRITYLRRQVTSTVARKLNPDDNENSLHC